jgi:ATP-dependent RNA helicase DeaD
MDSEPDASAFAAVPEPLRKALDRRGFTTLTAVQSAVLDSLAKGGDGAPRDLQITSQTGSGKTVALGFALAPSLLTAVPDRRGPTTLVIAPTRELAAQIRDELGWLFAELRHVTLDCVTGGTSLQLERQRLQRRPTVLVGTPGRLLDHVTAGALLLDSTTQLVLDEADQMLDLGFRDELEAIVERLPAERRTHLVSATFPPAVRALTKRYQRDPLHIEGTALGSANADIEHVAHLVVARDRYAALVNHLLCIGDARVLAFVRTREDTATLAEHLEADGFRALPISGDLTQAQRTRTLAAFRRGSITVLVATDVAARGLDIPDVQSVVHMDLPIDSAAYTHRSGRTGRAGQKGTSVLLVPRSREGAARRLLAQARVPVRWRAVPSPDEVFAAQHARVLDQIHGAIAAGATTPENLELAQRLLAGHAPATVVATLLGQLSYRVQEPRPVSRVGTAPLPRGGDDVALHADERAGGERRRRRDASGERGARGSEPDRPGRPGRADPADSADAADRGARGQRGDGRFVIVHVNWGSADGADPRRVLAHVCRRGDIDRRMVGAIDIGRTSSSIAIAADVAREFAQRVRRRDRRDPHLVIRQDDRAAARGS